MRKALCIAVFVGVLSFGIAAGQNSPAPAGKPFVIEYYYKVKWGHADEFLTLFKKNHYPLLKKEIEFQWIIPATTTPKTGVGITG